MAQQCFMFLDWGDGWVAVNDHDNDVAALDGFSGAPTASTSSPTRP